MPLPPVPELKLTAEVRAKILDYLRAGSFRETAAAAAGVSSRSFRRWLERAAAGEEPYVSFARDVETAMAQSEAMLIARIAAAGKEDWKAAAWIAERKHPQRWQSRIRVEVDNELSSMADRLEAGLRPEVFAEVYRVMQGEQLEHVALGRETTHLPEPDPIVVDPDDALARRPPWQRP